MGRTMGTEGRGTSRLSYAGGDWTVYDYGDKLPIQQDLRTLLGPKTSGNTDHEIRQCLLLHCTAGCLMARTGTAPKLKDLHCATQRPRYQAAKEALSAESRLGEPPDEMGRAEADVRVFAHDLIRYDHDKDYRCLVYDDYTFHVVRMDLQGDGHPSQAGGDRHGRDDWTDP